jgi:hypothetical protein
MIRSLRLSLAAAVLSAAVLGAAALGAAAPATAAGSCPVTDADAPGADGFMAPPAAFWAGVMVSDPDLFQTMETQAAALDRVEAALTGPKGGLTRFFEGVGGTWVDWRGEFANLTAGGGDPYPDPERRYLGVLVSIDRLIDFAPTRMAMTQTTTAEKHRRMLFGSIHVFDARSMSIAFSWPFQIQKYSYGDRPKLSAAGLLADPKVGIAGIVRAMSDPRTPSARASGCQLKAAILRYMGLGPEGGFGGDGDAAILFDGFQDVRAFPADVAVQGVIADDPGTKQRLIDLLVYLTRTHVARQKPVAPLANANREAVMTQGRAAILAQHDDRVHEMGHACGYAGTRIAWNQTGQAVVCFEIPTFGRAMRLGLSVNSKRAPRDDARHDLVVDSLVYVAIMEGDIMAARGKFQPPRPARQLDVPGPQMQRSDAYLVNPLIDAIQQIDVASMER